VRLLLVEDDNALVNSLARSLTQAGYAVDHADNGREAEYLGNEQIYDVVILDLGLPDRSGLEVLQHWRQGGNTVPVLILTARNAWHERVDGFKAGADDYLGKPFHVEELIARLNALIHRTHQQPGGILQGGDLVLEEDSQTLITADGQRHTLTGTEFRLMRYFLLHPERVLSKTTLTDHVYEQDADKDSNVIEVYINRLRHKIGKHRIVTRRGQGYMFRGDAG
jgi:DNA-binding response OmpR family regulator